MLMKHLESITYNDVTFRVGDPVFANHNCSYDGLSGVITKLAQFDDGNYAYVDFSLAESPELVAKLEETFLLPIADINITNIMLTPSMLTKNIAIFHKHKVDHTMPECPIPFEAIIDGNKVSGVITSAVRLGNSDKPPYEYNVLGCILLKD